MTVVASSTATPGNVPRGGNSGRARRGASSGVSSPVGTYEELRQEVLAELQRRSLDAADPEAIQTLARSVVDGYQAKARSGFAGRPLANADDVVARLCRSVLAWGPLTPHFDGEIAFEELFFHDSDVSWIDGEGRLVSLDEPISPAEVRSCRAPPGGEWAPPSQRRRCLRGPVLPSVA